MVNTRRSVIPETHRDILAARAFAHVATVGPRGEPQSSPVWFDWDGRYLRFSQTTARQKYRNLRRNPRIALSMTDPENPYRYLEIRGEVVRIEEDRDRAFIDALAKKYLGKDRYPWAQPDEERVVMIVEPRH